MKNGATKGRKRKGSETKIADVVSNVDEGPLLVVDDEEQSDNTDTESDEVEVDKMVESAAPSSSKTEDCQTEFKVLGQTEFTPLEKVNVTTSWVSNATLFPGELVEKNLSELSTIDGIPDLIAGLVRKRIKSWFPVQKSVIPTLLHDVLHVPPLRPRDIAISAPTGSGKTLSYVLPILTQVGVRPRGELLALIVVPVQTLVTQIKEEFAHYNAYNAVITALSGATDFSKEQRQLAPNSNFVSDVIISTPERLMDHLTDPSSRIDLSSLRFLVVDEADRMGPTVRQEWLDVVERRSGGLVRCTSLADLMASRWAPRKILLSATLSRDVEELHMWNLHQPRLFCASISGSTETTSDLRNVDHVTGKLSLPSSIHHTVLSVEQQYHPLALFLKIKEKDWKKVLVFTNERESSLRLNILISRLAKDHFRVEHLTSDLHGNRRTKVLRRFRSGTTRVLICSDVLSRGVDVEGVDCVVNYELPKNDRLFVHRAGRTGRAGKTGEVLSLGSGEARKIFVKNVLRKNGLWINADEETMDQATLEPHLHKYKKALKHLKKSLEANKSGFKDQKQKVSGFAYRKKSRYNEIKEKLEANKNKPWKKEKKDFAV
ncbi:hypothetical protein Q1695_013800 [Nippostrongylus brasiliensis]|nr:hypothetical protein Q1695_013800 [Nippostrongylus brasiliensis]